MDDMHATISSNKSGNVRKRNNFILHVLLCLYIFSAWGMLCCKQCETDSADEQVFRHKLLSTSVDQFSSYEMTQY
jgi:hypothetical protein